MALTPFTGIGINQAISFDSRGYAKSGKVHFSEGVVRAGDEAYTLCGRVLRAVDVYQERATNALIDDHRRLAKTHVVSTCARCVART